MGKTDKQKIVLIIANTRWRGRRPWMILAHAPLILTALLKNEFDFCILDANVADLSESECEGKLRDINPDAVLVSGFGTEYHQQYHAAFALAKRVNPKMATVLGGVYPTVLGEEAIKDNNIDYLFIGHAEERVVDFMHLILSSNTSELKSFSGIVYRDASGAPVWNPVNSYIADVKKLTKPDYSLMNVSGYLHATSKDYQFNSDRISAPLISSFGCPYNCSFCASRTISGRGVVLRPTDDVFEEIELLKNNYGVENLTIIDDCFLADRARAEAILNGFINRNYSLTWKAASLSAWHLDDKLLELMKESGCTQITVSVESGNQRVIQKVMHKPLKLEIIPGIVNKCKELEIDIGANFVIGSPGETWDEIRDSFKFAEYCNFDLVHFHIATPLPKTELFEICKRDNLLPSDFSFLDPNFFGYARGYITTNEFTPHELMVLRAYEWDRINFSTPGKTAKAAQMMCVTIDQLKEHRKQTRLKCGIHF
jgi:anaerobic magnesium-protoporphyrin IX monomethyl ester cyclase